MPLVDRIVDLHQKIMPRKASKIAELLGVEKKEVNQVLYGESGKFIKDIFFNWRLK